MSERYKYGWSNFDDYDCLEVIDDTKENKDYVNMEKIAKILNEQDQKIKELEQRIANCIELPQELQVGGKIFWANEDGLYSGKVYAITKDLNYKADGFNIWIYCVYNNGLTFYHLIKDFGVELFATEEEAKAKLEEIQNG